jgi:hypothetical protein
MLTGINGGRSNCSLTTDVTVKLLSPNISLLIRPINMPIDTKWKVRKYDSAIDTSCAFETNDLNLTTENFDSYGNVSFEHF